MGIKTAPTKPQMLRLLKFGHEKNTVPFGLVVFKVL